MASTEPKLQITPPPTETGNLLWPFTTAVNRRQLSAGLVQMTVAFLGKAQERGWATGGTGAFDYFYFFLLSQTTVFLFFFVIPVFVTKSHTTACILTTVVVYQRTARVDQENIVFQDKAENE